MGTQQPLRGRTILVTRDRLQARALSEALAATGASPVECPLIAFSPPADWGGVDSALARLPEYHGLIFTSANAVRFFVGRLRETGICPETLRQVPCFAIGPATAQALQDQGYTVQAIPEIFQAEGMISLLAKGNLRGKYFLLPRAREARQVLPRFLEQRGARVDLVTVYETRSAQENRPLLLRILKAGNLDYLTFTSTSTVVGFGQMAGEAPAGITSWKTIPAACIGEVTARSALDLGFARVLTATAPTLPSLVQAILNYDKRRGLNRPGW